MQALQRVSRSFETTSTASVTGDDRQSSALLSKDTVYRPDVSHRPALCAAIGLDASDAALVVENRNHRGCSWVHLVSLC